MSQYDLFIMTVILFKINVTISTKLSKENPRNRPKTPPNVETKSNTLVFETS